MPKHAALVSVGKKGEAKLVSSGLASVTRKQFEGIRAKGLPKDAAEILYCEVTKRLTAKKVAAQIASLAARADAVKPEHATPPRPPAEA